MGGNLILGKASCPKCAAITSKFEMDVLRKQFITFRSAQKLPTRGKLPEQFEIKAQLKSKTKTETAQIAPEYLPIFFPLYDPPAYFDGRPTIEGTKIIGMHHAFNPALESHLKKRGIKEMTCSIDYVGGSFERLLAKIAYCHVIYRYCLEGIKEKLIVPVILGRDAEFNRYIGVENQAPIQINNPLALHTTDARIRNDGLVLGYVQLFGFLLAPIYTVIVGRTS